MLQTDMPRSGIAGAVCIVHRASSLHCVRCSPDRVERRSQRRRQSTPCRPPPARVGRAGQRSHVPAPRGAALSPARRAAALACASPMMRCDSCSAVVPDLVRELLRRHQRGAQVPLLLPVLLDERLGPTEIVAQAIRFTERLVVVGRQRRDEPRDLPAVEPSHGRLELLCPADRVAWQSRRDLLAVVRACAARRWRCRSRTIVEPSCTATSKSWLMPIESSRRRSAGTPAERQPVAQLAQTPEPGTCVLRIVGLRRQQHQPGQPGGAQIGLEDGLHRLSPAPRTWSPRRRDRPARAAPARSPLGGGGVHAPRADRRCQSSGWRGTRRRRGAPCWTGGAR